MNTKEKKKGSFFTIKKRLNLKQLIKTELKVESFIFESIFIKRVLATEK